MGKHSYFGTKSVRLSLYIHEVFYSNVFIRTKLQGHTLVMFSTNTDFAVLSNSRRAGSSDACDRYDADAVLFWPKDERVVVCIEKYARIRGHSEYARNS